MKLPKKCVIMIVEGRERSRGFPQLGEYKIITHQGKVERIGK